tara:strand:+ start:1857 stop:2117 length:261 start_codon:yes stop_codon:yes gene_type:complete
MNFNERGLEAAEAQRVFAKKMENEFGNKFYVLYYGGKVVDPGNLPTRNQERFTLRSVTEPLFNGYLSFLAGREQRKLREINRSQHV